MIAPAFPSGTREVLVFLATAGIVVPVFHRLRISPVLGFIAAGVVLGPFGLGRVFAHDPVLAAYTLNDVERVAGVAAFGVVFLLFMIGLELSFERLTAMRRLVFGLGPLQVVLSAIALGVIGMALSIAAPVALVLGGALALSSTAIVLPVLADRKRLASGAGRAAFAVLLFQDIAVAPLLFGVTLLSSPAPEGGRGLGVLLTLVPAAVALGAILVIGRWVLRPLFHHVAAARSTELFMAACLFVVILTGAVAAASGLSMALGAFLAGLLLAETEYRREIEVTIRPFQGLLLGLFFVSVGAGLDLSRLVADPGRVVGFALGLMAVKSALLFVAGLAVRLPLRVNAEVALLLGPGGEFAFVIVGGLMGAGALPAGIGQDLLVAVTLTMVATPGVALLAERLGRRLRRVAEPPAPAEPPPEDGQPRVIIVGFGRVGRLVSEMLTVHKLPFLAIDDDPAVVAREREAGVPIYFGDATRPDFLNRCGLEQAPALVVTINAYRIVEQVVASGRGQRGDLTIVARARDAAHAQRLYDLGATDAVPETIEASLQLSEAVLVDVGVPLGHVIASIHEKRDAFRRMLNLGPGQMPERHAIRRSQH